MPNRAPVTLPIHTGALSLVAATASFGVIACTVGALGWGVLGVALGLLGSWIWFLLGLVMLYRREHQTANVPQIEPATVVDPKVAALDQV